MRPRAAGVLLAAQSTGRYLFLLTPRGVWETPGGHLEPGETPLEAAVAELQEETSFSGVIALDDGTRTSPDFVLFQGFVEREFRPGLSVEHRAFRWARIDRPPEPLHPKLRAVIG